MKRSLSSVLRARPLVLGIALLLALAAGVVLVLVSRRERAPESPWSEARLARLTLRQKAAQIVVARVPSVAPPDTTRERLRLWVRAGGGGIELPPGAAAPATTLAADLRREAPIAPLIVARVDRGIGGVFPGATELPATSALAGAGDGALAGRAAAVASAEARAMGIDLLLLAGPPLPTAVGPIATPFRAPTSSAALGAFVEGLAEGGVLAGVTSFTSVDAARDTAAADTAPPVAGWDRAALEVTQLEPLRAAVAGGAAAVEPGYAAVPALTGDAAPLPFSGIAVQGLLRRDLGFPLVVADVGPGSETARRFGPVAAAVGAVAAGADLVVGAAAPEVLVDSLVAAVEDGRIPPERIERAARRVFAAKERAGLGLPPAEPADTTRPPFPAPEGAEVAAEAFDRTLVSFSRRAGAPLAGCRKTVLAADPAARVDALVAELARRAPNVHLLRTHRVALRGPLTRISTSAANDADCVVAAVFPGAPLPVVDRVVPRAAAAGDSAARARAVARDTARRRIIHLAFAPTAIDPPTETTASLTVAGVGDAAQRAAARALVASGGGGDAARPIRPSPAWPPARVLVRDSAGAAGMRADSLARIDRIMREAISEGVFTGGAVAVARRGRLVKLTGYGRTSGVPVDPEETLFDIASLTKVVGTTAAAMALVEDGRIGLDVQVRRYVPEFRGGERGYVTIRHLLTHTSGLPAGADLFSDADNPEEALRRVIRTEPVRRPGEKVEYSDFGMILLAEVVRRRAGEPVDRVAARRVFVPLGMESTMYEPPLVWMDRTVPTAARSERPYVLDGVVHDGNAFRLGGVAGHAGLFSTAGDLAVYAQMLLNGGAYGERRIFSPSTVSNFTTKQPRADTRTLGWDTPARRSSAGGWLSSRSFGHTGYTGTSIWIDPMREIFVIVLTNRTYDGGTAGQILDIRAAVANAAVRSISDMTVSPRIGTPEAEAAAARERAKNRPRPTPRRPSRPRSRRG